MADITVKFRLLIIILIMSFIINLSIGVCSMINDDTKNINYEMSENKEITGNERNTTLTGLISIPSFFIPFASIISLFSLDLQTEIFLLLTFIIGIIEAFKTAIYIAILINIIPFTNT